MKGYPTRSIRTSERRAPSADDPAIGGGDQTGVRATLMQGSPRPGAPGGMRECGGRSPRPSIRLGGASLSELSAATAPLIGDRDLVGGTLSGVHADSEEPARPSLRSRGAMARDGE